MQALGVAMRKLLQVCFGVIKNQIRYTPQIVGLPREVINANCQFIVPIIRDKLPLELDKPECRILYHSLE